MHANRFSGYLSSILSCINFFYFHGAANADFFHIDDMKLMIRGLEEEVVNYTEALSRITQVKMSNIMFKSVRLLT
jgi:hypothetical protein